MLEGQNEREGDSMSRSASILKNTGANYIQQIVSVAVFMFLTPYSAKKLGTEQFGLWSLLWSMVGLLGLADLGISSAVVKFVSDARGRNSNERMRQLYSTFFWVQTGIAMIVLLLSAAITPFLGHIFDIPDTLLRMAGIVFMILSLRVATGMPFGLFVGLLTGHQRQAYSSLIKALGIIMYGGLAFVMLRFRPSAVSLAMCNIIVHLLSNIFIVSAALRVVPGFSIRLSLFRRALVREISSFSGAAFLVQISALLYTRVDVFVVQRFMSLASVACYSVAMQTIERGALFCHQMTKALTPMIAELNGADDKQAIRLILRKGTKLSTALATPLLGGLIWLAPDLIHSWMGPDFTASILPMRLLAGASLLAAFCGVSSTTLTMTGHQKISSRLIIAGQVLNLVLTLLLVRGYGLNGVAFASLFSGAVVVLITIGLTLNFLKISFWRTYGPTFSSLPPLALMIAAISGLQWASRAAGFHEPHLLLVAIEEGLGCLIFFAAFYLLGCSSKERDYYQSKLKSVIIRRK
jgi:O-antigen/teichoic acid export membrane protein